ncbi:S49 family peptidase [Roseovarius confluentis]|uniref:S49 family peptidase n=1 Tax=Roseovarius confluentis TaxID=1852027 RepID=UPI003BA8D75B
MRALDAVLGAPWAIQPDALEQIIQIASREHEVSKEALEKYRADTVARAETLEQRGPVAILNVSGPLFRRANLFTEFSGATSYDILRRDLQVALDNRDIRSILLNVDSPGGAVNGCGELAKAIFAAEKPVVAYVGGMCASAAYWLASAAQQILIDDAALLGSIGVMAGIRDTSERDRASGVRNIEFVSSQSPKKNPSPDSEEGSSSYQKLVDDQAAVFIAAVAKHRGITPELVASDYGQGGVLVGAEAVSAGMADGLGTFEDVLARLTTGETFARAPKSNRSRAAVDDQAAQPAANHSQQKEKPMADEPKAGDKTADTEAAIAAAKTEAAQAAVKADRERRASILALEEAKGREALAEHLYASTDMDVDTVKATLAAAPKAEEKESDPAAEYETDRTRANGAGLGGAVPPQKPKAKIDPAGIYAARRGE